MSIPEGEQFEQYLKQFRPLDPEPLPIGKARRTQRRFGFAAWAVATAAILAVAVLTIHTRPTSLISTHDAETSSDAERLTNPSPLTFHSANALLTQSSSMDEVVERLVDQSQPVPVPKGKHSALAVLARRSL